jgi:hypothetical protein
VPELPHHTIHLDSGRHRSPDAGMCVVELASVLGGEPFSDHPRRVCPVIAAFLRTYNDRIGVLRRQDLIPYAARIVDSVSDREAERRRAALCVAWAADRRPDRLPRHRWRLRRIAHGHGARSLAERELAAAWAARSFPPHDDDAHASALELLELLLGVGGPADVPAARRPQATVAA